MSKGSKPTASLACGAFCGGSPVRTTYPVKPSAEAPLVPPSSLLPPARAAAAAAAAPSCLPAEAHSQRTRPMNGGAAGGAPEKREGPPSPRRTPRTQHRHRPAPLLAGGTLTPPSNPRRTGEAKPAKPVPSCGNSVTEPPPLNAARSRRSDPLSAR